MHNKQDFRNEDYSLFYQNDLSRLTVMIRVLFAWAAEIALCSKFSFALSISGMLNLLKYLQKKGQTVLLLVKKEQG